MAGNGEWSKRAKISAVLEGQETVRISCVTYRGMESDGGPERYDHKQDCLFMDVPPEEKGRIAAQRNGTDKCIPSWPEKQFDETNLQMVSNEVLMGGGLGTDNLEDERQKKRCLRRHVRQDRE